MSRTNNICLGFPSFDLLPVIAYNTIDKCTNGHCVALQTSRGDERSSGAPTPESAGNGSRELLEDTLKGPKPYPNIVLPTGGGFWIDGQDQNEYEPSATTSSGGAGSWNNKIETDDTAKAYRRYYMGRVSLHVKR